MKTIVQLESNFDYKLLNKEKKLYFLLFETEKLLILTIGESMQ